MSHPEVPSMPKASRFRDFTVNRQGYELKFTRFNLHRQGVFDKKRKKLNSSFARQKLGNSEQKNLSEIMARNQTLLKPYEKVRPKQKRIMKERNNLA